MSLQVASTVRRDNVQFFTKRRFSALFWLTRTYPSANFHIGGRVCMQLFTYEIMSEIICLTYAKDCDVYSLWKTYFDATFWLTWTCPHANFLMRGCVCIQPVPQFPTFGLDRHVFHAVCRLRRVHARVHTLKDPCLLNGGCDGEVIDLLTYENVSMCNI